MMKFWRKDLGINQKKDWELVLFVNFIRNK